MPKTKWARYSAPARYTIATGGNVCQRHLKFKTNEFICLNERKKETTTDMSCAMKRQISQTENQTASLLSEWTENI